MRSVVSGQWSVYVVGLCGRLSCLLFTAHCLLACSVPNLEEADCIAARDVAREFYSFHFAHDMSPSEESIQSREKFLTPEYVTNVRRTLTETPTLKRDYFTGSEDYPRAFRVAECTVVEPGQRVQFNVLLFWKDDVSTVQKRVVASVKKVNDNWLIDLVSPFR